MRLASYDWPRLRTESTVVDDELEWAKAPVVATRMSPSVPGSTGQEAAAARHNGQVWRRFSHSAMHARWKRWPQGGFFHTARPCTFSCIGQVQIAQSSFCSCRSLAVDLARLALEISFSWVRSFEVDWACLALATLRSASSRLLDAGWPPRLGDLALDLALVAAAASSSAGRCAEGGGPGPL